MEREVGVNMSRVYADYNATYPCTERHLDTLTQILKNSQGNPSSIHQFGRDAKLLLEESREHIAKLLGAPRQNIYFTSGATEANNLAIYGLVERMKSIKETSNKIPQLVISEGEHPSVSVPCEKLMEEKKCHLVKVGLTHDGLVDVNELQSVINKDTDFVGIIYAHNEIGSINPIKEIAKRIKNISKKIHFHVDAVQAFGKLDLRWLGNSDVDSVAISAHKIGGLKGTGCLYLKSSQFHDGVIFGGGQERRLRSGTENMPGIISFGLRAKDILACPRWFDDVTNIKDYFVEKLKTIPQVKIHGDGSKTISNTVNFHVEGVRGEALMLQFDLAEIAVSSGSACSSGVSAPSPTLKSMGYSDWVASNSFRVSFGASSNVDDVEKIMSVIQQVTGGS